MKLIPISLSTNLLLAMLGTIVLAQVMTGALLYAHIKDSQIQWSALLWSERLSDLITSLDAVDRLQRTQILSRLASDESLKKQPVVDRIADSLALSFTSRFIERMAILQPHRAGISIVPAGPDSGPIDGYLNLLSDFPSGGKVSLYDVRVKYPDGTSSTLRIRQVDRDIPESGGWFIYPIIVVAALVIGA